MTQQFGDYPLRRTDVMVMPHGSLVEATFGDDRAARYYVERDEFDTAWLVSQYDRDHWPDDPMRMLRCQDPLESIIWNSTKFRAVTDE